MSNSRLPKLIEASSSAGPITTRLVITLLMFLVWLKVENLRALIVFLFLATCVLFMTGYLFVIKLKNNGFITSHKLTKLQEVEKIKNFDSAMRNLEKVEWAGTYGEDDKLKGAILVPQDTNTSY